MLFAEDMAGMAAFYGEKLGLPLVGGSVAEGFIEFGAGGVRLSLHKGGRSETRKRPPKIVFHSDDVAATRDALTGRGVKLGKVKLANGLHLCEGKDPEGNAFQLSNRST
jgi:predicted enzyme related to lactoylglutathione lyase